MNNPLLFTDIIEKTLIDKHMKKKELAEKMGKTPKNLSNILKRTNPTLETMVSFADALDCDLVISLVPKENKSELLVTSTQSK